MSLSTALNIISSSFTATAAQTSIISSNITNASTPGYTRKIANLATTAYGGVDLASVTSAANSALLDEVNTSTSEAAAQQALSNGLTTLAQTVDDSASASSTSGATQNGQSPSAMLANLQSALETYQASPNDSSLGEDVVAAAQDLATSLNNGSNTVDQVRSQADSGISSAVASINSLLTSFTQVNATIVNGLQAGSDITSAEDQRSNILTQLSQQIGISTVTAGNGSMSIYTDSGVTLFQDTPRTVSFTPTSLFTAATVGNAVTVDGVPISGSSSPMAIHSGALAGLTALRDTTAPEYQAQLDQIAGGLINAFGESDQSATPTKPSLPGLFTYPGATALPSAGSSQGLADLIEVNPNVDPTQGGNLTLLRDGGISSPNDPSYTYNSSGAASYTGRIDQMIFQLTTARSFDAGAGIGTSSDLMSYANDSVSWLQGENQTASTQADYQNSLVSQATSALSNASGVNMDAEMTNMLNIENSYTTTAKLLTTVSSMFTTLLSAIPA